MVEQRKFHSEVVGSNPTLAKLQSPFYLVDRTQKLFGVYSPGPFFFFRKREIVLQSIKSSHRGKMLAIIKMCIMSAPDLLAGYKIEL